MPKHADEHKMDQIPHYLYPENNIKIILQICI